MRTASAVAARITAEAAPHQGKSTISARVTLLAAACAACAAGFLLGIQTAASPALANADPNLTGLLRAMTVLKMAMAAAATGAVVWRLGMPARPRWLGVYALAGALMWAGPGLIWSMTHVGTGALLLHGGLLATLVLLWRDPAVGTRLAAIIAARREAIRTAHSAARDPSQAEP